RLCVVQAIPKGDRGEQAVETMTEVGVDVIVPWAAERCIAVWEVGAGAGGGGRAGGAGARAGGRAGRSQRGLARWRVTAREAAKQSRRARIPEVTELAGTADVLDRVRAAACAIVLDPAAGTGLGSVPLPATG